MEQYSEKKSELSSHAKTWKNLKCIILSERRQSEKAAYYMIPTIWHSGEGKTMETLKRSVVVRGWGVSGREMNRWRTQDLLGQWKYSVWYYNDGYMSLIHLSKPIECTTPRVNHNVNYGLWVITTCQCRFTDYSKCTTLVGDVDKRGGYVCLGKEVYGNSLYVPRSFAGTLAPL